MWLASDKGVPFTVQNRDMKRLKYRWIFTIIIVVAVVVIIELILKDSFLKAEIQKTLNGSYKNSLCRIFKSSCTTEAKEIFQDCWISNILLVGFL